MAVPVWATLNKLVQAQGEESNDVNLGKGGGILEHVV